MYQLQHACLYYPNGLPMAAQDQENAIDHLVIVGQ
jgi:hypothetical protein